MFLFFRISCLFCMLLAFSALGMQEEDIIYMGKKYPIIRGAELSLCKNKGKININYEKKNKIKNYQEKVKNIDHISQDLVLIAKHKKTIVGHKTIPIAAVPCIDFVFVCIDEHEAFSGLMFKQYLSHNNPPFSALINFAVRDKRLLRHITHAEVDYCYNLDMASILGEKQEDDLRDYIDKIFSPLLLDLKHDQEGLKNFDLMRSLSLSIENINDGKNNIKYLKLCDILERLLNDVAGTKEFFDKELNNSIYFLWGFKYSKSCSLTKDVAVIITKLSYEISL